jgi:gliding motility-associated-like protein
MKKFSLLIISLVTSMVSVAQNDCQEIAHSITSSTHTPIIEVDPISGETIIYYDLCLGEELTLIANAVFPENNTTYTQTLESTEFSWYVNETATITGSEYTNIYNSSEGFIVSISSIDVNDCENLEQFPVYVRVSTVPTLNLSASPSTICPDILTVIGNDPASDVNVNIAYVTDGWISTTCEDEFSDPLYLPDGSGVTYNTDITLECFGEGQTLTNVNDIVSIDINMEHSYTGDLDMFITAPNGVQVQLFAQAGGGTWLGEATDQDATATNPGIGYDYGWSMNPTYNGTMAAGMADNTSPDPAGGFSNILNPDIYLPLESLNALLGTPLNGVWTITIVDNLGIDNGWIFSWGVTINAAVIPSFWNYDNFIVDEYWEANPTIVSTSGTDLTILPTTAGQETFTYVIEDNFGCVYSEDLNLTVTTHVTTNPNVTNDICGSDSGEINLGISGGTPTYSVDWNSGAFTGQNLTNVSPGEYNYLITDAIGCEFSGVETVITEVIELEFDFESENDLCDDEIGEITIIPLNGYSPYSYAWNSPNPNSATAANIGEGTYIAAVTDSYGCEGIAIQSIDNDDLELLFDFTSENDHCDQDIGSATVLPLNGTPPYTYNWDNGFPDDATALNLNDGEYDVFITDGHGCEGETTVEVINIPGPTAHFDATFDTVVYKFGLVDFLNFSYSEPTTTITDNYWSFGEGTFSNAFQPSNDFNQIGTYIVELTVTDSEGCTDNYFKEIVAKEDYLFWPPTAFTPNGDNKNDVFRPILRDILEDSYEFYIYDRWGKLVFQTVDLLQGWDGIRDDNGTEATQGAYTFLVLFNTKRNVIEKKTGSLVLLK